MFKKPSSRRKTENSEITLNLVPILDAMVTLIAFLLFSSSFLAIAVIDTPAPVLGTPDQQEQQSKDRPLQLTAMISAHRILIQDWTGSREKHIIANVEDPNTGDSRYDFEKFHQLLLQIKNRYPKETKLILKPDSGVAYETIIELIDRARFFEPTDPALFKTNAQGVDEVEKKLFPEVIFGNIMS
ncbi:MAG: ExbD/TolR family protein [Bacteriovoracia bacterium]